MRNLLVIFFSVFLLSTGVAQNTTQTTTTTQCAEESIWDGFVGYAKKFIGIPYRLGATGLKAFDCSGFTSYVLKHFGMELPRTAAEQGKLGVKVGKDELKKGDLIFFKGRNLASKAIGHVAIVISELGEPIRFIHASSSRGVVIDALSTTYFSARYILAKRVSH